MKKMYGYFTFALIVSSQIMQAQSLPTCEKQPKKLEIHGDVRIDNYYWLNDYWLNGPQKEKVVAYLTAENDYFSEKMKSTEKLQEDLYKELLGRIKQTDESVPYFLNGYWYLTKTKEGLEYPIYLRKKGSLDAPEELLLDVNKMAEGFKYFSVGGLKISPDNQWLCFGVDTLSRRQYTLYFKNLESGEILTEKIENTNANVVWANDSKTIFYSTKDPLTLRSDKIYSYEIGSGKGPQLVYNETDETFSVYAVKTKSDRFIMITSYSTLSNETRYIDANRPADNFQVILPREKNHLYIADQFEDNFYITTNWNAVNFKLMVSPIKSAGDKANWKVLIPERKDVLLEEIEIFKDYMVVTERSNALTHLRVMPWKGGEYYIQFDESAYVAGVGFNPEFNTAKLRFNYQSLTTPSSQYEFNMADKSRALLKRQEVLGGYNPDDYFTERLWVTARDGVKVPMTIVYKKGFKRDGTQPVLLYGYGSYGATMDPYFSANRLSLLDRGFAFAIAHIRGGQEMGRQWYEDGKMFKKMNTFNDFIDCGEFLLKEKYTTKEHLYASGGSAGGLLMGAVANLRPDMWKGILSAVPFVDVVTTMLDESIPLTTSEYDEWGNPNNKDSYFYMKSYSPYDNITAKAYPNMLITTGLHDSQVQYFEPAKYVAKLRELKTDNNLVLMHCDMSTGHGGSSGRFQRLKEIAREYAFMLMLEGILK